ncbi:hypothetical protein LMH87_005523 [Akanthomyces muscarius]|uniref:Uncharacterized protein n=1 Tax=Akanthomyces muscarius TaxID=2231603 RepID=A0A9W8QNZ2_AKAMU|nr:hypothetical protein LMH87_005523 [Akanthomyces muscarius]KAJ4163819.1 hypothetical protein LMH87_005523 [Akanthomyces muscarius]
MVSNCGFRTHYILKDADSRDTQSIKVEVRRSPTTLPLQSASQSTNFGTEHAAGVAVLIKDIRLGKLARGIG